jgi:hypothetical protein
MVPPLLDANAIRWHLFKVCRASESVKARFVTRTACGLRTGLLPKNERAARLKIPPTR